MKLALVLLMLCAGTVRADCPQNEVVTWSWDGVGIPSTAPSFGYASGAAWSYGMECEGASYDLREGFLCVRGAGGDNVYYASGASVSVSDVYTVVDVPGVYAFTAEFQVDATGADSSTLYATIAEPAAGTTESFGAITHAPQTTITLVLPLHHAAGEPFTLTANLATGGFREVEGDCRANGRIRFRGLPAGARVVSCQSYDLPVPAHPLTWGAVKARYR
jgi:hypothetical protein